QAPGASAVAQSMGVDDDVTWCTPTEAGDEQRVRLEGVHHPVGAGEDSAVQPDVGSDVHSRGSRRGQQIDEGKVPVLTQRSTRSPRELEPPVAGHSLPDAVA